MAHKAQQGATYNGRDSESKRLGVKKYDGEKVLSGNIIVRQRGYNIRAGNNVRVGKDYTLYSIINGTVKYTQKVITKFNMQKHKTKIANVLPT